MCTCKASASTKGMTREMITELSQYTPAQRKEIREWFQVLLPHLGGRDRWSAFYGAKCRVIKVGK